MNEEQLIGRHPTLWHLCASNDPQAAWTRLQQEGLLSVEALADAFGVLGMQRHDLLRGHRPQPVHLGGDVIVRDTRPMSEGMLRHVVEGETPDDWRARLNGLVFFHPGGIGTMPQDAPARHNILWQRYATQPRLVLVLDTHRVVAHVGDDLRLSPINTGAARMVTHTRGPATIRRLPDWPAHTKIAEVAVLYRLDDIAALALKAAVWHPDGSETILHVSST